MSTVPFYENTPDVDAGSFSVPKPGSNFCNRTGSTPMGIRIKGKGFLIKGVYGDGKKQEDLREGFMQQVNAGDVTDRLLMYALPVSDAQSEAIRQWESEWEKEATAHIKNTTVGKKGAKLVYSSLLGDDARFKFNVPYDVADLCRTEAEADSIFDLGNGVYDLVFRVSGTWRNNTSYGLSLSALRIRRVRALTIGTKRKAPAEFEFAASEWDVDGDEVEGSVSV